MKPGIYSNITNEEYHKMPGISNSGISLILDCPARYYYEKLSGLYKSERSNELIIGSAVDTKIFEPELFDLFYTVLPEEFKIKAGKKYEAYRDNESRHIFSRSDFQKVCAIAAAVNKNPIFKSLKDSGKPQQTLVWEDDNGVILRSRPDWMNDDFIIDLKTTKSVHPDAFSNSIGEYNYHTQAYMQLIGAYKLTNKKRIHLLLAVEKEDPYITEVFSVGNESLQVGRMNCLKGAFIYQQCTENKYWPSYGNDEVIKVDIKPWLLK